MRFDLEQLPLNLYLPSYPTFANFFAVPNQQLITTLQQQIAQQSNTEFIFIWGKNGVGKTHILQACCNLANASQMRTVYLPLQQLREFPPAICEDLEAYDLVCIDDIDQIAGISAWEESLFHLYNRLHAGGSKFVITANKSPKELEINLADLLSRLSWGLVYQLQPLQDSEKLAALQLHAKTRGLVLSDSVGEFLLKRYSRDMAALCAVLNQLDHDSLAQQRRVTIPFVKLVLKI